MLISICSMTKKLFGKKLVRMHSNIEGIWELETPAVMTGGLTGGNSRVAHCYIFLRYPPKLIAYVLLLHYNSCVTHEPKNKCVAFCSVCAYVVRSMYTALPPHSHCNT